MQSSRTINVVGCHAEGEVGRVITGGVLPPPGATLFDKKRYLEAEAVAHVPHRHAGRPHSESIRHPVTWFRHSWIPDKR